MGPCTDSLSKDKQRGGQVEGGCVPYPWSWTCRQQNLTAVIGFELPLGLFSEPDWPIAGLGRLSAHKVQPDQAGSLSLLPTM